MGIRTGDKAPDFTLPDQNGAQVQLSALLQKGPVVVYFYPKDETPGCTAEACAFRDAYEDFKTAGAQVVGISSDSSDDHASFATHHRLPFILAADKDGAVRKLFGVPSSMLGLLPGRVTYVVDRSGVVRHMFNSQLQAKKHVAEALEIVKQLASGNEARAS